MLIIMHCFVFPYLLFPQGSVPLYPREKLEAFGKGTRSIRSCCLRNTVYQQVKNTAVTLHLPSPI